MKTILASLSAVALSLSFSACHTAPKHGTCPITGATAPKACCATKAGAPVKACCAAKKSCCGTKGKTAKTATKKSGASCCG